MRTGFQLSSDRTILTCCCCGEIVEQFENYTQALEGMKRRSAASKYCAVCSKLDRQVDLEHLMRVVKAQFVNDIETRLERRRDWERA